MTEHEEVTFSRIECTAPKDVKAGARLNNSTRIVYITMSEAQPKKNYPYEIFVGGKRATLGTLETNIDGTASTDFSEQDYRNYRGDIRIEIYSPRVFRS